ncbi:MAG: nucleotidyltransferase family protein [Bacteroidales bacterium]|nr:nucleotidyltransferase family protein [Bacteroidales bacterium]MBR0082484.1 nucleotidyltransferase family protein [Bacteroidales bacterium]
MNTFFELLQFAAGTRDSVSTLPAGREEWEELFNVTGKHNLLGVTFPVIDALHDETEIPLSVYSRWAMAAEKIEQKNIAHKEACRKLYTYFSDNGFRSCIFKGQAVARLYPRPELRQCGDIDIWLEGERDAIVEFLRARFPLRKIIYIHCDVQMLKGISVEVHFTPSWVNNPFRNRRMQAYFKELSQEQFSNYCEPLGCNVPTRRFDAVYMMTHIYRHVLTEGIGLRQLLDYYYVLKDLPLSERERILADLKHLSLSRFAAGVMYVLSTVFGAPQSLLLLPPDKVLGEFLIEEIMLSGNFGKYDPRNVHDSNEGKFAHASRKLRRNAKFMRFFPGEIVWMPFFILWQYFWRRKHNYLYKGR